MDHEPRAKQDGSTPVEPLSVDEQLRRDEPPVADDDTTPRAPLSADAALASEEPPVADDDTAPRPATRLDERLRDDEPPVRDDDTSPSAGAKRILTGEFDAVGTPPRRKRWVGAVMLIAAVALAVAAGALLLRDSDDNPPANTSVIPGGQDEIDLPGGLDGTPVADAGQTDPTARPTMPPMASATPRPTMGLLTDPTQPAVAGDASATTPDAEPSAQAPTSAPTDSVPASPTSAPTEAASQADSVAASDAAGVPVLFPTAGADVISAALSLPVDAEPGPEAVYRSSAPFTVRSAESRSGVTLYTVREGDTLESIAEQFGLKDIYSIIWSNKSGKVNPLRPGEQINILPEDGIYHEVTENVTVATLAEEYKVDPYAIIDADYNTDLFGASPETLLVEGMWVVVPGGEKERQIFLPANTSSGASAGSGGSGTISGSYSLWGCTANVGGGTMPYSRPVERYRFMQDFSFYGHTGVDLAYDFGEPIYAAGSGTVVYAGWSAGGYGNVVVVAHGPVFTLYAHLDSYKVRCNQQVSAGQVIGLMGSTGNSSGPHLHFEVRDADFNLLNPHNYVGF